MLPKFALSKKYFSIKTLSLIRLNDLKQFSPALIFALALSFNYLKKTFALPGGSEKSGKMKKFWVHETNVCETT